MKLNLGCGNKKKAGWVNVDLFAAFNPDIIANLEHFPYPWEDNSVDEILLNQVLEHLGQAPATYLKIIQELYRICRHRAVVHINVPHPRHDYFINDPTHVRAITPEGLALFDQALNRQWLENNDANTPLGIYLNLDFRIDNVEFLLEPQYIKKLETGELTTAEVHKLLRHNFNICHTIEIDLIFIKE